MVARHEEYYFEDGNVVFQVGQTLFRIHKRLLIGSESSVFASMLSLPQSQNIEGRTDERPIVLEGDSLEQFEALMKIIYPPLLVNIFEDISIVTYARAMRIAVKYEMNDVQVAIVKAIQLDPPQPLQDLSTVISRLAFVAEFQSHFTQDLAIKPLLPYPAFIVLVMKYREGLRNKDTALWPKGYGAENRWLNEELGRFGFIKPVPKARQGWY